MTQQPDLTEWDDDLTTSPAEDYDALVRAIQWAQGFGLLFVQCSPAEGERLIARVSADVTEKAIAVLRLTDEIEDLYEAVKAHSSIESTDVLFITGLEKSLTPYIKPGYGSEGDYYAKDTVPKLLGKLNLQREQFREDFPVCFVFLVPSYAMKYLTRRAADFFDWRSGIWEFVSPAEERQQASERILQEGENELYLTWTPQQRRDRLGEIEELLAGSNDLALEVSRLRFEQGNILLADKKWAAAIIAFDAALAIKPDYAGALNSKGVALNRLERYEEAIATFDAALAIKLDDATVLVNKGYALNELGRYEEAMTACDAALAINPNYVFALNNKGIALEKLGRYEEAIAAYDAALVGKPDHANAYNNKGYALYTLGKYEAAVACFKKALAINPNHQNALNNRKLALAALEPNFRYEQSAIRLIEEECAALTSEGMRLYRLCRYEEAITHYNQALAKKTDYYEALHHKGVALAAMGHQEAAIDCYEKVLKIQPDDHDTLCDRGKSLGVLGRYEDALNDYDRALTLQPKSAKARYGKQDVRRSMTGPKVESPASTHSQQSPQNFFQRCIAACAKLWTAFWNFTKSRFRL